MDQWYEAGMADALPHPIALAPWMLDKIWSFQVVWTSSKATTWKIHSPAGCELSPSINFCQMALSLEHEKSQRKGNYQQN